MPAANRLTNYWAENSPATSQVVGVGMRLETGPNLLNPPEINPGPAETVKRQRLFRAPNCLLEEYKGRVEDVTRGVHGFEG